MEENAKVTGFHSIDSIRFEGFTEQLLSEFERVIASFYQQPTMQAMATFHDDLRAHIYCTSRCHSIDLSPFAPELIKQLFRAYRDAGFKGTVTDMFLSIVKLIEIGSHDDVLAGISQHHALNILGWQYLFNAHRCDKQAHSRIFDLIQPHDALNREPVFHFDACLPEYYDVYKEHGYTIPGWNRLSGTLFFDFLYDNTSADESKVVELFSINFLTYKLWFDVNYSKSVKGHLQIRREQNNTFTLLTEIELPFEGHGYDRFLLSFVHDELLIRDLLKTVRIKNFFVGSPLSLHLEAPLGHTGTAMREISYYRTATSPDEQLFFLN